MKTSRLAFTLALVLAWGIGVFGNTPTVVAGKVTLSHALSGGNHADGGMWAVDGYASSSFITFLLVIDCQDFDGDGVYGGSLPSSLTYTYSVSNQVPYPGSDAGGITISAGTANLYSQFRAGALAGFMSA